MINNLFNLTVSPSKASLDSVTKEIKFYEGMCSYWNWSRVEKKRVSLNVNVNVIDTIGKCVFDSSIFNG